MKEPLTIVCTACARSYEYAVEKLLDGGLIRQGWECAGGKRVCPNCRAELVDGQKDTDEPTDVNRISDLAANIEREE